MAFWFNFWQMDKGPAYMFTMGKMLLSVKRHPPKYLCTHRTRAFSTLQLPVEYHHSVQQFTLLV